ncbi:UNVERIFIED_CONTAM: hypothetical protein RMT77_011252 [Armadillidium vulgare]
MEPVAKVEDIDKSWLKQVISDYHKKTCDVLSFNLETRSKKEGFLSEIAYIEVELKLGGEIVSEYLVAKCMPHSPDVKTFVLNGNLAKREVEFYNLSKSEVFQSILENNGKDHSIIPEVLFSEFKRDNLTILMKNMKSLNYKTIMIKDGNNLDQTLKILSSIAIVHAAGLSYFKKYENYGIEKFTNFSFFDQFLSSNIETLSKMFAHNELREVFKKLVPVSRRIRDFPMKYPLFETVIHGDLWSNQCMFSRNEKDVVILDWQFSNVGNPVVDLMGMFFMSTDPAVLEEHLDEILDCYWQALNSNLKKNDVIVPCSFEDFVDNVECHWMTGFLYIASSIHDFLAGDNISLKRLEGLMNFLNRRKVFSKFLKNDCHIE